MKPQELKKLISQGETTTVQLKRSVDDAYDIGTEMVAFSNSYGGKIIVGVNDKTGEITGLSYDEIQTQNNLLVNAASENVKPAIVIHSDTVEVDGKNLIVVTISEGMDKPYKDNKGIIWVKNGSDKRKVFSNTELRVMMQRCGTLSADTDSVEKSSYSDIDIPTLKSFLFSKYRVELEEKDIFSGSLQTTEIEDMVLAIDKNLTIEQLLKNILILDEKGQLTLTGLLLLSKNIQRYRPVFTIKCISFVGNSLGGMQFRDKLPDNLTEGNLLTQYNAAISFIRRNLRTVQVEKEFNTLGELEIPLAVFIETITNALIHRDYYIGAPVRLFIFDNRIELHSPGILPETITEKNITNGISVPRNELLFNNAKFLLPYTGAGSGMMRVVENYDKIAFNNNLETQEFVVTMMRENIVENEGINGGVNGGDGGDGGVNSKNEGVNDGNYDGNYDGVRDSVTDSVIDSVIEEKILFFTVTPKSRREIMELLGLIMHTKNYERHIVPLLSKGLLAMTIPDKPNSKHQKYVTTEKGKRILNKNGEQKK